MIKYRILDWELLSHLEKHYYTDRLTLNRSRGDYTSASGMCTLLHNEGRIPERIFLAEEVTEPKLGLWDKATVEPVGWILVFRFRDKEGDKIRTTLECMTYVQPAYRRKQIGTTLFGLAGCYAKEKKLKMIVFRHTDGSDKFYQKAGEIHHKKLNLEHCKRI